MTPHASSYALGLAASALVAATLVAATPQQSGSAPPTTRADDPRTAVFIRLCSDCHDAERIVTMRRTAPDWEDIINKMVEKGLQGSEKELETVYDYVVRNYGKVYINTAKAADIAMIVGVPAKDAEAIVAYRTANGPFADFDAVKKVPGIDLKTLEAHKDAVAF